MSALEFGVRVGLGVRAEAFGDVGELVAEEEGPGVGRELLGGEGMDEDGAIGGGAADADEGAGVFAEAEVPVDLPAGGAGDFAGDELELAEIRGGAIAGIGAALHAAAVLGAAACGGAGFDLVAVDDGGVLGGVGEVDFDFDFGVAGSAGDDGRVLRSESSQDVPEVGGGPGSRARDGDGATMARAKAIAKADRVAR